MPQLVNNERVVDTIVYVADFAHIAANATSSKQVTIGKIPAGGAVLNAFAYEAEALTGASDITLDLGTTALDPDEFINAWDADSGTPAYNTGDAFDAGTATSASGASQPVSIVTSETSILAEWNGTVASLTAGKVVVVVEIFNPGKFA
jgi:hypothetical protein